MFQLALEIGSDFADIFTVKAYDFSFGDPLHAPPLPALAEPECSTPRRASSSSPTPTAPRRRR